MKKIVSFFLSFVLGLGMVQPINATEVEFEETSEEIQEEKQSEIEEETTQEDVDKQEKIERNVYFSKKKNSMESSGESNQELFSEYVEKVFSGEITTENEPYLNGDDYKNFSSESLEIYRQLYYGMRNIANGECASTEITVDFSNFDLAFEVEEIEEDTLDFIDNYILEEFELIKIVNVLLADCPYEFYWYDKTTGWWDSFEYDFDYDQSYLSITSFTFYIAPIKEFSAGDVFDFQVDTKKTGAAKNAAMNANSIVEEGKCLSDFEKLKFYGNTIIELTDYNYDAIEEDYTGGYGNPWQLIYVFDGDDSTNVVCEGYSKAFQYLFDQSSFTGDISCRIVTGDMSENLGGSGPHMWNVITMENGKNYLVDITNSEDSTSDRPNLLLKGGTYNKVYNSYLITAEDFFEWYRYDEDTYNIYAESELEIPEDDYNETIVILSKDKCILTTGETVKITATSDAYGDSFVWKSLDNSVAEVGRDGTIRAKQNGETTICVSSSNGGYAQVEVIVQNPVEYCGTNMNLSSDITMNYYVRIIDSLKNNTSAFIRIIKPNEEYVDFNLKNALRKEIDGQDLLMLPIGISPKDITGTVNLCYYKDSRNWESVAEMEVEYYLYSIYEDTIGSTYLADKKIGNIVDCLLKYCYFAQEYFEYRVDDLPMYYTNLSTTSFLEYKYDLNDKNDSIEFVGARLVLGYMPSIKLYFNANDTIKSLSVNGVTKSLMQEGKYKYIIIPNIADFSEMFNISSSKFTLKYGIYSYGYSAYLQNKDKLLNLVLSMYEYDHAVKSYLNLINIQ